MRLATCLASQAGIARLLADSIAAPTRVLPGPTAPNILRLPQPAHPGTSRSGGRPPLSHPASPSRSGTATGSVSNGIKKITAGPGTRRQWVPGIVLYVPIVRNPSRQVV